MSNNKQYQTAIVFGRFQPVHNAHVEMIRRAGQLADQVIIIIGSAQQPRTYKNPFNEFERKNMLVGCMSSMVDRDTCVRIEYNTDTIYDDNAWAQRVQAIVAKHTATQTRIAVVGHKKDASTFYLDMFPQWALEEIDEVEPLNATDIRSLYFTKTVNLNYIKHVVPESVLHMMVGFANSAEYRQIIAEREFIVKCKKPYESLPYPPIFVTVDAMVIQSGHVLMIQRRAEPGRGLWALPGGYLNAYTDRSIEDAMVRELREETGLKVPSPVLVGNIESVRVFDAVDRSPRGRIITHCHKITLPAGKLPKVKGSDDASKAEWVPLNDIDPKQCFEDHFEMIQVMK